jgi:hypothetical protein
LSVACRRLEEAYFSLGLSLVKICSLLDSFLLETVHLGVDYVRIFMFHAF